MADSSELKYTKAKKKEVEPISGLEALCFPNPWTYDMLYSDICENKITEYVLCSKGERPVGYGGMWLICDEAHITNICTHPKYRKKGIGSGILEWLMKKAVEMGAERMTLEVRVSNVAAMHLYESHGFHIYGKRNGYYSDNGEDAYILWCDDLKSFSGMDS